MTFSFRLSTYDSRLQASALFYAVLIALVLGILSGSLVLAFYLNRMEAARYLESERLLLNAGSGVLLAMHAEALPENPWQTDLYGEGRDSVEISVKPWGIFEVGSSRAYKGNRHFSKCFQFGRAAAEEAPATALYLTDRNKPLSLCGTTLIRGTCYLPEAGVKRAYIEGKSFAGKQLIEGAVQRSEKTLPEMNTELLSQIRELLLGKIEAHDSLIVYPENGLPLNISRSFASQTLYLAGTDLLLDEASLSGNICIVASGRVQIGSAARIKDVLVFAQEIYIENGFGGSLQAFASERIVVGEGCTLKYPSVVGVVEGEGGPDSYRGQRQEAGGSWQRQEAGSSGGRQEAVKESGGMEIGAESLITGIVFTYSKANSKTALLIRIEKDATVHGQVYTTGSAGIKGSVHGSVYCGGIVLKTPSSVYENHLLDATIDATALSGYFVGSLLLEKGERRKIVKWLE